MNKKQLIDRHARTLKSWVGTSLAKDECIGIIKNAVDEALILCEVSRSYPSEGEKDLWAKEYLNDINKGTTKQLDYLEIEIYKAGLQKMEIEMTSSG